MPSTPSGSLRIELQAAGENLNTWGAPRLNTALSMIEAGGHGLTEHTLTANKSLTYTNYTLTDGTDYVQKIVSASDGSYELELGGFERSYVIWNDSGFSQTITCSGGGTSVSVADGEIVFVYCDATNVVRENKNNIAGNLTVTGSATFGGAGTFVGGIDAGTGKVTNVVDPTANQDAATKKYVDDTAFNANSGILPGQTGNQFATLTTDGTTASWEQDIVPEVVSAAETMVARRLPYLADLSGGAFTLTLPASPSEGDVVQVITDANASSNNLTIGRNGETIGGVAEDMTINLNGTRVVLVYSSSNWRVYV